MQKILISYSLWGLRMQYAHTAYCGTGMRIMLGAHAVGQDKAKSWRSNCCRNYMQAASTRFKECSP